MTTMNRRLLLALSLSAALLPPTVPAHADEVTSLSRQAEAVIARLAPAEAHVGVSVVDIASGETLYARDANKLFTPASLVKLTTSGAALSLLGAQKRFTTRLLADGATDGGLVRGALYLRGEGDPSLSVADLDALAKDLHDQGVKTIAGDLVADTSYFQPESPVPPGWVWDDLSEDYGAPASALSVSHNMAAVTVWPGASVGAPARVVVRPMTHYIEVRSRVTTPALGTLPHIALTVQHPSAWKEVWEVTGAMPPDAPALEEVRVIAEPARMAAVAMKEALERQGIQLHGHLRLGTAPASARAIVSHQSPMLGDLIRTMNKESDNLFAETMLLHLGVRGQGAPGTREKGVRTLKAFLERLGWSKADFRLEDGSGLSRYDALTPGQLTALLCAMPAEALAYPAYLISLPVAGVDGTLAARLGDPAIRGRMRAKTGSMSSVSNLAGYLTTDSGRTVAVAVMVNGFMGTTARAREMQDALVQAIAAGDADTSAQK